jgi:hypothetical protein
MNFPLSFHKEPVDRVEAWDFVIDGKPRYDERIWAEHEATTIYAVTCPTGMKAVL